MKPVADARANIAKTNYLIVFTLWVAGLTSAAQFAKISVAFDVFGEIYPEAGTQLGLLLSLISFMGIIFGLYAGVVVARVGFKRMLIFALLFGALMSLFQVAQPRFEIMLMSRLLEGLSHLAIVVAAPTLIAKFSAPKHVNMTLTLWSTFFGVAYALTTWLGLPLIANFGLAALFVAHAAIMTLIAAALIVLLPKDVATKPHVEPKQNKSTFQTMDILKAHRDIYSSPFLSAPAIGWLCYTLTYVSLITVLPGQLPDENKGLIIGFLPLIGIVTSMLCGVILLKFVSAVHAVTASFVAASITLSTYFIGAPIILIIFISFALLGLVQSSSFSAVGQLIKSTEERAKANGAMAQMGNLGNTVGTPLLLLLLSYFGINGMILSVIIFYAAGASAHLWLEQKRRKLRGGLNLRRNYL